MAGYSYTGFRSGNISAPIKGARMTCDVLKSLKGGATQKVVWVAMHLRLQKIKANTFSTFAT